MFYLNKPFGKRLCNGETEHAPSKNTKDRTCPANKESSAQFIPTDKAWMQWYFLIGIATFKYFKLYKGAYFCAINIGSKNSDVIRWAYREQADNEQRPENNKQGQRINRKCYSESNNSTGTILTTKNEINTSKTSNPGFVLISSTDFGAFHSNKGKYGTEKTQTDCCNHQSPARLDVTCRHKTEVNLSSWGSTNNLLCCSSILWFKQEIKFVTSNHNCFQAPWVVTASFRCDFGPNITLAVNPWD